MNSSHPIVIHSPSRAVSGWRREVRYTLCPHIPSCRRASPTGRIPPSPQFLIPRSQVGSIGGWADGLQRGDDRWGDPHQTLGGEWHLSPPFRRDKASWRSQRSFRPTQETFPSLSCQVFTFPLWAGGDFQAEAKCVQDPGQLWTPTV